MYKKIINEMEPYKIIYSIMNDIKKVTEKYESATDANDLRYFKEEINECVIDYNKRSKR